MKYSTNFRLLAPVTDIYAARNYLTENDMTVFLKEDDRLEGVRDHITHIEWELREEASGVIWFTTDTELTEEQLDQISKWVSGQNSDGLGEGFEQQDWANYKDDDYDDEDEDYYDEWVMASFDWQTNNYEFTKVEG